MVRKNIGVSSNPPSKSCNDVKCPWHGKLSLRGSVFIGRVISTKAPKTAIVRWERIKFLKKLRRYERRKTRVVVYKPDCIDIKDNDRVKIAECRPLSKTKSFVIVEKMRE
jgi:small subunit ribosomal protein S17